MLGTFVMASLLYDSFSFIFHTGGDMLLAFHFTLLFLVIREIHSDAAKTSRSKRWLVFTPSTQFGALLTISTPLENLSYVSFAYFFEANYYTVDNSSYLDPLLGDNMILTGTARKKRGTVILDNEMNTESYNQETKKPKPIVTRSLVYQSIEKMLQGRGLDGRRCLLRAICDNAVEHFHHNGLLGDLLHIVLTPSSSWSEEAVADDYYWAEWRGRSGGAAGCSAYIVDCPTSVLDLISLSAL